MVLNDSNPGRYALTYHSEASVRAGAPHPRFHRTTSLAEGTPTRISRQGRLDGLDLQSARRGVTIVYAGEGNEYHF